MISGVFAFIMKYFSKIRWPDETFTTIRPSLAIFVEVINNFGRSDFHKKSWSVANRYSEVTIDPKGQ